MISYFLKSGILLLVFYAVYKLWLENEKMFRFNRAYLLGSLIFSLIIPLQLFSIKLPFSTEIGMVQLDGIVIRTNKVVVDKIDYSEIIMNTLGVVYVAIALILIFRFALNLFSFYKKIKNNKTQIIHNRKVILIRETILPHSFWNAIFINAEEFKNGKIPSELIAHEEAHIKQKHSLDIILIEILQIIFWFNPLIVLYKKAVKLNHEFLADEAVNTRFNSVRNYQTLLLKISSNKSNIALASTINYAITKKRLLMMTKKESPIKIVLKILSVSAVYVLLLFVFSSESTAQSSFETKNKSDYAINYVATNVIEPQFPGGITQFYMFVGKNFKIPKEISKLKLDGKLVMEFMVEKDGSLSEFKIKKDLGYGLGDEAIRVLKLSPKWIPATEKGKAMRVSYVLPITIQADK